MSRLVGPNNGLILGPSGGVVSKVTGAPPAGGNKTLLTESDFTFLGWYRTPIVVDGDSGNGNKFSNGGFAVRVVDGQTRWFMLYGTNGPILVEMVKPAGEPSLTMSTAPRATELGKATSIWGGKDVTGVVGETAQRHGLFWDGTKLWMQFGRPYAGSLGHYPSIVTVVLDDNPTDGVLTGTPYGPWRTEVHSQRSRTFMTRIPSWFATEYLNGVDVGIGAQSASGVQASPFGINLNAVELPAITDPTDLGNSNQSALTTVMQAFDINNRQSRPGYYINEGPYACDGTDPPLDGGTPTNTWLEEIDDVNTCVWIDGENKHGVVWFGSLLIAIPGYTPPGDVQGYPHGGYGDPYGGGRVRVCCHGQDDPYWKGTGPWGHCQVPYIFIQDPLTIGSALENNTTKYNNPASTFPMYPILTLGDHASKRWAKRWAGTCYYDSAEKRLYLPVRDIDTTSGGSSKWAIAVFSVNDTAP